MKSKILIFAASALLVLAVGIILLKTHCPQSAVGIADVGSGGEAAYRTGADCRETNGRITRRIILVDGDRNRRQRAMNRLSSEDPQEKLAAAAEIAAFNDEEAFESLAECIAREETSGDDDLDVPRQLGAILTGMRGEQLAGVATKLAYSPSPTVAEAATDVAVTSAGGEVYEAFETKASDPEPSELTDIVYELLEVDK